MDLFDLRGRVAVVTGGSQGLGRGMALALARAGADVVVVSRSAHRLSETLSELNSSAPGGRHGMEAVDVSDLSALAEALSRVDLSHGGLDILLNAAAVQVRKPALEVTPAEFDRVMAVNLRSAYFASQFAARIMQRRGRGGKIIHVASLGTAIGLRNVSIYTAAKSGIAGMLRTMALEWAPLNIQVNAVGPGYYRTELTESLFQDPERRDWVLSRIPMGRSGVPADLEGASVFLASRASDYITGQILYVDGGWLAG